MTENKEKGLVLLAVPALAAPLKIFYDYDALSEVDSKFGFDNVGGLIKKRDLKFLIEMIYLGAKHHQPDLTLDDIRKLSPPLMPALNAVGRGIQIAMLGTEADKPRAAKEAATDETPSKKASRKKG
jgi:hypothetical protein